MSNNYLNVALVEDIQHALHAGMSVETIVANLRSASLPAIIEYESLYRAIPSIPLLPSAIRGTVLGKALHESRIAFESLASTDVEQSTESIKPRAAEATRLDDIESRAWGLFETRFSRSAEQVGLSKSTASLLQAALREMAENTILHSQSPHPPVAAYRVHTHTAQFCVGDFGIGVLKSLRSCRDFQHVERHCDALRLALHDGNSRFGLGQGGFGFRPIFKALTAQWGQLRFRSGTGCISMSGADLTIDHGGTHFPPFLPGFQVTITCRARSYVRTKSAD